MADDNQLMQEHKQTWKGFTRLLTISTVIIVICLALMGLFLL